MRAGFRVPEPPDGDQVAAAFGLGRALHEPTFAARGELGRIWRIDTASGSFAVKELFDEGPGDGRDDVAFQRAAASAGVPLPAPLETIAGEVICRIGDRWIRGYQWVDLDAGAVVGDADAGALLARVHLLRHPAEGVDPWYTDGVGEARWNAVLRAAVEAHAPWAEPLAALVPDLLQAEHALVLPAAASTAVTVVRCHLDFHPQNVLVDVRGQPVVLDWENSGGAVPEREVVMALWEFVTVGDDTDVDRRSASFIAGYREAGGVFEARDTSAFAMAFAVQAHLLELFARRALDPQVSGEDQERSHAWVQEMVACPLTPDAAARVLDTIA